MEPVCSANLRFACVSPGIGGAQQREGGSLLRDLQRALIWFRSACLRALRFESAWLVTARVFQVEEGFGKEALPGYGGGCLVRCYLGRAHQCLGPLGKMASEQWPPLSARGQPQTLGEEMKNAL